MKLRYFSLMFSILLISCQSRENLVGSYDWVEVDGDENFIEKEGNVVIDRVSMIVRVEDAYIVESWANNGETISKETISCSYHMISPEGLKKISKFDETSGEVLFQSIYSCAS